jgi:L-asparagine transporter-like permease
MAQLGSIFARKGWGADNGRTGATVGLWVAVLMQFMAFYLDSTAQVLYVAQYWDQLFPDSDICLWKWLLLVWAMATPLIQIPTFHESRYVAMVILVAILLIVLTFLYEVPALSPPHHPTTLSDG